MGKSLKKVIGVAAAIAIPFAAPAIAASIGLSGAIGATLGSGLTGAALGAGTAALTGQNIGRGALFGGLAGGLGGYMQGAQAAQAPASGVGPIPNAPVNYGAGSATAAPNLASMSQSLGKATSTFSPIGASGLNVANTTASGGSAFLNALKNVPKTIAERFSDPNALADLTLRAAGNLAGSAIVGTGLSPAEQQLLQAQTEELAWLRQNNQAAFQERLRSAQELLGQAKYFDPEYFGLQAARRQQLAGTVAEREGLRGLTGAAREAEQRRYRLGTARNVGTAYDVGYGQGVQGRTQLTQAGLQALPNPNMFSSATSFSPLFTAYGQADTRRQQGLTDMGSLFGSFISQPSEAERRAGLIGGGP